MTCKLVFALFMSVFMAQGAVCFSTAADYYVDANSGDDGNDGTQGTPWRTITRALDWIASNNPGTEGNPHTIHAAAGTYAASTNNERFPLNMQSWVSLVGDDVDTTILNAESTYHVAYCFNVSDLSIEQLTITGGDARGPGSRDGSGGGICCDGSSLAIIGNTITGNSAEDSGGGVFCYNSSPMIQSNTITGNSAGPYGGGIFCEESSPTIENNLITENAAANFGGAIFCTDSSPTISNNAIEGNSAGIGGGGISCWNNSSPIASDNTIEGNSGGKGGGVHCDDSSPTVANNVIEGNTTGGSGWGGGIYCIYGSMTVKNNLIVDNSASSFDGGGICCMNSSITIQNNTIVGNTAANFGRGDGIFCDGSSETITDCIIWDNGDDLWGCSATYCCIEDDDSGEGNIHEDPDFVTGPLGDYYLDTDSPCIDAGSRSAADAGLSDRTTQVDGTLDSGTVDMGYHHERESPGPELSDPTYSPESGRTDTDFTFTVHYYHPRGQAPSRIQVFVNGKPHDMKLDSGSAADGVYAWTGLIPEGGLAQYHFEAEDSYGASAICLEQGRLESPPYTVRR